MPAGSVAVDTQAAAAPVIESVGSPTTDNTVTLTITAEAGATVRVYGNGELLGTAAPVSEGSTSYTLTTAALPEGAYRIAAVQTDAAGNSSVASAVSTVVVDTVDLYLILV